MSAAAKAEAIHALRRQLLVSQRSQSVQQILPTDLVSLDAILPHGGLPAGSLIEWVSADVGLNSASIALRSIVPMLTQHGCLAIIDERHEFYAEAVRCHGIPLSRILLIRPARPADAASGAGAASEARHNRFVGHNRFVRQATAAHSDALWALEQTARCQGVRVALTFLEQASSAVMRRLQLAVERSGVTIVLIRPASIIRQPSFADLRLYVTAVPPMQGDLTGRRRMKVQLLRSRHGLQHSGHALLEVDHETGALHSISELADSKPATAPAF